MLTLLLWADLESLLVLRADKRGKLGIVIWYRIIPILCIIFEYSGIPACTVDAPTLVTGSNMTRTH